MSAAGRTSGTKFPVREKFVEAAERLFTSRDYGAVSLDDVAREAGFYPATLRLYFQDKETLYLTIVLRGMRILHATYAECSQTEAAGLSRLRKLGRALIEFSRRYPDYYRLLYNVDYDQISWNGGADARAVRGLHDRNLGLLYRAIEECVHDGTIKCDLEPEKLIVYLVALSIGLFGLDPGWRLALEVGGIDYDQFIIDFHRLAEGWPPKARADSGARKSSEREVYHE
ncbi:MAG TPA: TetR/AcrR family transcriptional regulator [Methanocella sp.]|nr:TetR/AcrR family transcriptional regulator [Methanocella sp.]